MGSTKRNGMSVNLKVCHPSGHRLPQQLTTSARPLNEIETEDLIAGCESEPSFSLIVGGSHFVMANDFVKNQLLKKRQSRLKLMVNMVIIPSYYWASVLFARLLTFWMKWIVITNIKNMALNLSILTLGRYINYPLPDASLARKYLYLCSMLSRTRYIPACRV